MRVATKRKRHWYREASSQIRITQPVVRTLQGDVEVRERRLIHELNEAFLRRDPPRLRFRRHRDGRGPTIAGDHLRPLMQGPLHQGAEPGLGFRRTPGRGRRLEGLARGTGHTGQASLLRSALQSEPIKTQRGVERHDLIFRPARSVGTFIRGNGNCWSFADLPAKIEPLEGLRGGLA